jgi:hypothetical protein
MNAAFVIRAARTSSMYHNGADDWPKCSEVVQDNALIKSVFVPSEV